MDSKTGKETDIVEQLVHLQEIDRARDRLQKRLDEVPVKLKRHTDRIAELEGELAEQEELFKAARAEADRHELEVKANEEKREKFKQQMNAPKLSNREYEVLQESLAGVFADINSASTKALQSMERAGEAEKRMGELRAELEKAQSDHATAREKLEGGLSDVKQQLEQRDTERDDYLAQDLSGEALALYDRVRRKHREALAVVDGTIDREANRIGNDLHCAACYMSITANDALHVLARKRLIQCKSCGRILYVP